MKQQLVGVGSPDGGIASGPEGADERRDGGAERIADPAAARQAAIEQVRPEDQGAHDRGPDDAQLVVPTRRRQGQQRRRDGAARGDQRVAGAGHRRLPDDAVAEIRSHPLVGDAGQGIVGHHLSPAVGALPHRGVIERDHGVAVTGNRHALLDR